MLINSGLEVLVAIKGFSGAVIEGCRLRDVSLPVAEKLEFGMPSEAEGDENRLLSGYNNVEVLSGRVQLESEAT